MLETGNYKVDTLEVKCVGFEQATVEFKTIWEDRGNVLRSPYFSIFLVDNQ